MNRNARFAQDTGFTLIEGMLASVIVTIGFLTLAGMQGISFGRNVDANELTQATNLAADIMERIQYNRKNALAYNAIDTSLACTQSATTQPMARGDCDQWKNLLASSYGAGLSGVRGQVSVVTTGPTTPTLNQRLVTVTLTWTGTASASKVARSRTVTLANVIAPE